MKVFKRCSSVFLILSMLACLMPALDGNVSAEAPFTGYADNGSYRSTISLDAENLRAGDTVVAGSASTLSRTYPLEWLVLDADSDSTGTRKNGMFLLSKYLLPSAEFDAVTGGLRVDDSGWSNIRMPEDQIVMDTSTGDAFYAANTEDWCEAWEDEGIGGTFLALQAKEKALSYAKFFALSAEEAERFLVNTAEELSETSGSTSAICRPFIYSFCHLADTDRSWLLRSESGDIRTAISAPDTAGDEYIGYEGGFAACTEEDGTYWSRPAFNLDTDHVSFWYAQDLETVALPESGSVYSTETDYGIGLTAGYHDALMFSDAYATWKPAIESLGEIRIENFYLSSQNSLTVSLSGDEGHKIGFLVKNANGIISNYGSARISTTGDFSLDISRFSSASGIYLFSYDYDTDSFSGQIHTSKLVELNLNEKKSVALGASFAEPGDALILNGSRAYLIDSGFGSTANRAKYGGNGSLSDCDSQPVQNDDAVFVISELENRNQYSAEIDFSAEELTRNLLQTNDYVQALGSYALFEQYWQEKFSRAFSDAETMFNSVAANQAAVYQNLTGVAYDGHSPLGEAILLTWKDDDAGMSGSYRTAAQASAVDGEMFFYPSAAEYQAIADDTASKLGRILLRNGLNSEIRFSAYLGGAVTDKTLTVNQKLCTAKSGDIEALQDYREELPSAGSAVGYNIRKSSIAWTMQHGARDANLYSGQVIPSLRTYDEDDREWLVCIADEDSAFSAVYDSWAADRMYRFNYSGAKPGNAETDSFVSVIVADEGGTVKKYARLAAASSTAGSVDIDLSGFELGDKLYIFNEYCASGTEEPVLYCSPLNDLNQLTILGTLSIQPQNPEPQDVLTADLSQLQVFSTARLCYEWTMELNGVSHIVGHGKTQETTNQKALWTLKVWDSSDPEQFVTACVRTGSTQSPVRLMSERMDEIIGDTLYFGGGNGGTKEEAWTILGNADETMNLTEYGSWRNVKPQDAIYLMRRDVFESTENVAQWLDTLSSDYLSSVLSSYQQRIVLRTDIKDAGGKVSGYSTKPYSADNLPVFLPSIRDYMKLDAEQTYQTVSGKAVRWLLRTPYNDTNNWYVDSITELQRTGLKTGNKSAEYYLRPAVNLDATKISMLVAADSFMDQTGFSTDGATGQWKVTMIDMDDLYDFKADCGGTRSVPDGSGMKSQINICYENAYTDITMDYYVSVLMVKDGKVVNFENLDLPYTGSGQTSGACWVNLPDCDTVYVLNRLVRPNFCTDLSSRLVCIYGKEVEINAYYYNEPTQSAAEIYLTDDYGEKTVFAEDDRSLSLNVKVKPGYGLDYAEVRYETVGKSFIVPASEFHAKSGGELSADFVPYGNDVSIKVYFKNAYYPVSVTTTTKSGLADVTGGSASADVRVRGGECGRLYVSAYDGYYISSIKLNGSKLENTDPIRISEGRDSAGTIEAYPDGVYAFEMPNGALQIDVEWTARPYSFVRTQFFPQVNDYLLGEIQLFDSAGMVRQFTEFAPGQTVYVKVPCADNIYVRGMLLNERELSSDGAGGYSFVMPETDATLSVYLASKVVLYTASTPSVTTGGTLRISTESVSPTTVIFDIAEGTEVTVTPTAYEQMKVKRVSYAKSGSNVWTSIEPVNGAYKFKMPSYNVSVKADFESVVHTMSYQITGDGSAGVKFMWGSYSVTRGLQGDALKLVIRPEAGCYIDRVSVDGDSGGVILTDLGSGTYSFTMPDENVVATIRICKAVLTANTLNCTALTMNYSDDSYSEATAEDGTPQLMGAAVNSTVKLGIYPNSGYTLHTLQVSGDGESISVSDNGDGTYSFVMPQSHVDVYAECTRDISLQGTVVYGTDSLWAEAVISSGCNYGPGYVYFEYDDANGTMIDWDYRSVSLDCGSVTVSGEAFARLGSSGTMYIGVYDAAYELYEELSLPISYSGYSDRDYSSVEIAKPKTVTQTFEDVSPESYYYDAVEWAYKEGVTTGVSKTMFSPRGKCARAQLVCYLWRLAGKPVVDGIMPFDDVSADAYYAEAVRWATSLGIIKGMSDRSFAPDGTVTRAQAVTMLYRFMGSPSVNVEIPFSDVSGSSYCYPAVQWAWNAGITKGTTDTTFSANADCIRADIACFLFQSQM